MKKKKTKKAEAKKTPSKVSKKFKKSLREQGILRSWNSHKKLYEKSKTEEKAIYHAMCMDELRSKHRKLKKQEKQDIFVRASGIAKINRECKNGGK